MQRSRLILAFMLIPGLFVPGGLTFRFCLERKTICVECPVEAEARTCACCEDGAPPAPAEDLPAGALGHDCCVDLAAPALPHAGSKDAKDGADRTAAAALWIAIDCGESPSASSLSARLPDRAAAPPGPAFSSGTLPLRI